MVERLLQRLLLFREMSFLRFFTCISLGRVKLISLEPFILVFFFFYRLFKWFILGIGWAVGGFEWGLVLG
jgi:hypothetical protein